ncbi:hypothetical protein NLI96_g12294 [Meripilus lineatus]|uniref:Uncharacterized protein n=1 Tax=Meripilus lineatus TaxID=2056292 RepID=A0AAD5UQD1_9APHY|nr:hypothetical protein NLI96_g12294 [Physisporinus lineatus]
MAEATHCPFWGRKVPRYFANASPSTLSFYFIEAPATVLKVKSLSIDPHQDQPHLGYLPHSNFYFLSIGSFSNCLYKDYHVPSGSIFLSPPLQPSISRNGQVYIRFFPHQSQTYPYPTLKETSQSRIADEDTVMENQSHSQETHGLPLPAYLPSQLGRSPSLPSTIPSL